MRMIKICPECGAKNNEISPICSQCNCILMDVTPQECADDPDVHSNPYQSHMESRGENASSHQNFSAAAPGATIIESGEMTFLDTNGSPAFSCQDGVIGRQGAGAVFLKAFPTVSRNHCRIWRDQDGWKIEDCGSSNGTFLNGRRITEAALVRDDDILNISKSCQLRIKL